MLCIHGARYLYGPAPRPPPRPHYVTRPYHVTDPGERHGGDYQGVGSEHHHVPAADNVRVRSHRILLLRGQTDGRLRELGLAGGEAVRRDHVSLPRGQLMVMIVTWSNM